MAQEFYGSGLDIDPAKVALFQNTKRAIDPSYKMRLYNIKNFFRDFYIIGEEEYSFSHSFWYKHKISLIYYSQKYNSCLNVILDEDNMEWYWVPSELARLYNNDGWSITTIFPTVMHSEEDDIKGLIEFAKLASMNPKIIKVDEDHRICLDGVDEWIKDILNTKKDPTLGLSTDRFLNMFKNSTAFNAAPFNPIEREKYEVNFALFSLHSALVEVEKTIFKAAKSQSVQNNKLDNSEDCFVVTATFGTPYAKQVVKYRNFRDKYLSKYLLGRIFIDLYTFCGPNLAAIVKNNPRLKLFMAKVLGAGSQILPDVKNPNLK
ncbi:CFI-box-CTERM domain-containing protein [Nodularia chucula]|uniref:CFI-box-CTERM domain-containing protein n=1 Tax=Nodularia chucula TaxID=3093667 RepID=UPI0039C69DA5